MTATWKKLGLLYTHSGYDRGSKLFSHAANPLPVLIKDDVYRIFFSSRDINDRSSVGAVDIDIVKREIIRQYSEPFFEYGPKGSFYADGVSIGNCYQADGIKYMLFMGWQTPLKGHWRGDIGRLIVKPDLTLELAEDEPLMGVDDVDPISLSYPWVMPCSNGGYHMWYGSTRTWDTGNNEMLHVINHAASIDGHHWVKKGLALPYEIGVAQAFSRPTVVDNIEGGYSMWFSYRSGTGEQYRIGCAVCKEGGGWELKNSGVDVSLTGWDSEMIEYPYVFNHQGQCYMLYNGNEYGKEGFGMSVLIND